jgi:phospholipase/lecithinase/hemolysin
MLRTFVFANKHFLSGGIMRTTNAAPALLIAVLFAACGGGGGSGGHQPPPAPHLRYSAQVTFGDALSDVGSYAVGAVRDFGGGKFTINGSHLGASPALSGKNWTELMAARIGLPAPCAAQTGLAGDPALGYSVPVQDHAGCLGYAQGGAAVTDPAGWLNAASGSPLGALTVPVAAQVARHLAVVGGKFKGDEIVFVNGGGSDLRMLLSELKASAAGSADFAGAGRGAIDAMTQAANELGDLVRLQMLAKGANFVVVQNLPDPAKTPEGLAEPAQVREIASAMAAAFNAALRDCFAGDDKVLLVDLDALVRDEWANPASYGLSNVVDAACAPNALGGLSLVCNSIRTLPGVDVGHYMFADGAHPTPYQSSVIERNVAGKMMAKGWL